MTGVERVDPAKFFIKEDNNGGRVTRQGADPMNLRTEIARREVRKNRFSTRIVANWNALPADTKRLRPKQFKSAIKLMSRRMVEGAAAE